MARLANVIYRAEGPFAPTIGPMPDWWTVPQSYFHVPAVRSDIRGLRCGTGMCGLGQESGTVSPWAMLLPAALTIGIFVATAWLVNRGVGS